MEPCLQVIPQCTGGVEARVCYSGMGMEAQWPRRDWAKDKVSLRSEVVLHSEDGGLEGRVCTGLCVRGSVCVPPCSARWIGWAADGSIE